MLAIDTSSVAAQAQQASLAGTANAMSLKGKSKEQIDKSAKDFEAVFATEMLNPMFESVGVDETFGGGHGEEMFRTLITDQYGKAMAKDDTFHIASQVTNALLKIQEGKH